MNKINRGLTRDRFVQTRGQILGKGKPAGRYRSRLSGSALTDERRDRPDINVERGPLDALSQMKVQIRSTTCFCESVLSVDRAALRVENCKRSIDARYEK